MRCPLKIRIFADGANRQDMLRLYANPLVRGFTTNPSLMRAAGITDYRAFARDILAQIPDLPISLEVLSDDFAEMERQALTIAGWGGNVFVKIPVTNSRGEPSYPLIRRLAERKLRLNVTALMTIGQVRDVSDALGNFAPSYISIFAGRVADTGRDPVPLMAEAVELCRPQAKQQLLWASPRELLNLFQANAAGVHIITLPPDLIQKLILVDKDLAEFSRESVEMFVNDAAAAGFTL